MKKKAKIVFETVVSVRIDDPNHLIIQRLLDWQIKENIYSLLLGSTVGAGIFRAFYAPKDANKVQKFIKSLTQHSSKKEV